MLRLPFSIGLMTLLLSCLSPAMDVGADSDKPQYGSWGFDSAGTDMATKPGADFFRYANGTWLDRTTIPADKPAYSLRIAMTDTIEMCLHDIMEQLDSARGAEPDSVQSKVGAFYHAFMDEARIEQLKPSLLRMLRLEPGIHDSLDGGKVGIKVR